MDPLSRLSDKKFKSMAFVLKYCRTSMDESFTVGNLYSLLSSYKIISIIPDIYIAIYLWSLRQVCYIKSLYGLEKHISKNHKNRLSGG